MGRYKLIELDKAEASVVRRRLHQWSKADEQAIVPLIGALQQKECLSNVHIKEPRWETNVYPLYYWAQHEVGSKRAYDHVFETLPNLFPASAVSVPREALRQHVKRMVNSEIDILVEDVDYFVFIEAKESTARQKVKFQDKGGVRQLVRQYVQGKCLERLTAKVFALATIGANNGRAINIQLNATELALLQLVNDERQSLEIIDLSWKPMIAGAQSAR